MTDTSNAMGSNSVSGASVEVTGAADGVSRAGNALGAELYDDATLAEAREFFSKDVYASEQTGVTVEAVGKNYAKCSLEIGKQHCNAYGGVMGGVMFTLADFTFAVSSNFRQGHTVSVTSQINFTGMAKGKKLIAESRLIKDGRTVCLYAIDITDELGTKVAFVTFSGMKLAK